MKKYTLVIGILICLAAFKKVIDKTNNAEAINKAINKSLPLLQSSSHEFLENAGGCHSCHHNALGAVTFSLAKGKGFVIHDNVLSETLDSIVNTWNSTAARRDLIEYNDVNGRSNLTVGVYDLWALSVNHYKESKGIEMLIRDLMNEQTKEGCWVSPYQRPPLECYSFSSTALMVKTMPEYAPAILQPEASKKIEHARSWLINTIPHANEERVFQLLGLTWTNADKKFIKQQADKLLAAQHEDGGWSQLDSLQSDAYATGQSLFALNQSGQISTDEPPYQKGISFLIRTQFTDGSWKVQTRSYPVIPYLSSGFPHGANQFISAAGSNWATMALILAAK